MNPSQLLVEKFYTCFSQKDWSGMQACYHDEITFSDPVFVNLKGRQAKAMWQMLVTAGKDLVVTFKTPEVNGQLVTCDWEASYTFSTTGKKVHNIIKGQFEFKEGRIIRHTDAFDLWRWTRMALGLPGILLGWSTFLQSKLQARVAGNLERFIQQNS